jgi:prophage antirepressor-like protein
MLSEQIFKFGEQGVSVFVCRGLVYIKASDITKALQYKNATQAIADNVAKKYVKTLKQLKEEASSCSEVNISADMFAKNAPGRSPFYIQEPGVYELMFGSRMPAAVKFREWVVEEVLPEIRKTGKYVRNSQVSLMNENDLHFKVVDFIRKYWPEALRIAGLGELQDSDDKRIEAWRKGYTKGQPDLIIMEKTSNFAGLVIELKTPLGCGTASPEQLAILEKLKSQGYSTLLSCDYDEILTTILQYRDKAREHTSRKARVQSTTKKMLRPIKKPTMFAFSSSQGFSAPATLPEFAPDAAMVEPASKKPKIAVATLQELDLQTFSLKLGKKLKNGQTIFPLIGGEVIRANLTPNDWVSTPWGFDLAGRFEIPSFLGGKEPEKPGKPEGLKLNLNLESSHADFLQKLDQAACSAFAEHNPQATWQPLVKEEGNYSSCKVTVVLKGDGLTKLAVVSDGKVRRGEGWEFLNSFASTFARSQVKVCIRVKKLWTVGNKAGLSLEATQLVLKTPERPVEEDAFANDNDLLA